MQNPVSSVSFRFWSTTLMLVTALAANGCGDDTGKKATDAGSDGGSSVEPTPDASCELGTQGCDCSSGDKCGKNSSGETLMCVGGICESASCTSGDRGCVCRNGTMCTSSKDSCEEGFCQSGDCKSGEKDCPCAAGSCDAGLVCMNGTICKDSTGFEGGKCLANNTCERGNSCDPVQGLCVHCELGSAGCQCTDSDACNVGLSCAAGLCVSNSQLPPDNPKCYTPCRKDLASADEQRTCDADGVFPGCFEDQECTEGSCLEKGKKKPKCDGDIDCPFFQVCLQGGCYSNCEVDADCSDGLGCYKKACRIPCDSGSGKSSCPSGLGCEARDGEHGYCTPVAKPGKTAQTLPDGGFTLSSSNLTFTNVSTTSSFQIIPTSAIRQQVTIRKLRHTIHYKDGKVEQVSAPKDLKTGEYTDCDAAKGECPLSWLSLSDGKTTTQGRVLTIMAPPTCTEGKDCPKITVGRGGSTTAVRWEGELEITSKDATVPVFLSYVQQPDGQWSGTMYYFGTFEDEQLDDWKADRTMRTPNGLINVWGKFRQGNLGGGWDEMLAVLTSTRTESWDFPGVKKRCHDFTNGQDEARCYPYSNTAGVKVYVEDNGTEEVPSGVTDFPIAFNVKSINGTSMAGRIASATAMQYPANPAVHFEFDADPGKSGSCNDALGKDCVVFLKDFGGEIDVGGRYYSQTGTCATGYTSKTYPWLIDGFNLGTVQDMATGSRYRDECRDNELPYDTSADAKKKLPNIDLSGANPIPDGLPRIRHLELIDGAIINQTQLFVIFKESFESFIPGEPEVSAYGYMVLAKGAAELEAADFSGNVPPATTTKVVPEQMGAQCSQKLLTRLGWTGDVVDKDLVAQLIDGTAASPSNWTEETDPTLIHYLCEDTGMFDGGKSDTGAVNTDTSLVACPIGSKVTYFITKTLNQTDVAGQACNNPGADGKGTCQKTLTDWLASQTSADTSRQVLKQYEPMWKCTNTNQVFCDADRFNLRNGKRFWRFAKLNVPDPVIGLLPEIAAAFRYKVRFQSDQGGQIGFAPRICIPDSDEIPYCYDPKQIEDIRERLDCLIDIYTQYDPSTHAGDLKATTELDHLNQTLRDDFSEFLQRKDSLGNPQVPVFLHEGFERLYSELLIMQGDEAFTAALQSRFDLAATGTAPFEGSLFEDGGPDLTGVAGFEMYRFYQATQYYQQALDRLYNLGPNFAEALSRGQVTDAVNFVSPETVTLYLERVIRAATQKALAFGYIATRYQALNRPDLARTVIERAYTATYLESILISQLMTAINKQSSSKYQDQIRLTIVQAQMRYLSALSDLKKIYRSISDSVTNFGFPADYIPFPSLDGQAARGDNAYDVLASVARQKVEAAKQRELTALEGTRTQRTDSASFQAELVRVRNNYENQLVELCGTFEGEDGRIYPAIATYAHMSQTTSERGDPCGLTGSGNIHEAIGNMEASYIGLKGVFQRHINLQEEIEIEQRRIASQCNLITGIADLQYTNAGKIIDLKKEMADKRLLMSGIQKELEAATSSLQLLSCESFGCAAAIGLAATNFAVQTAANVLLLTTEKDVNKKETEIAGIERDTMKAVTQNECERAKVDSIAIVEQKHLQMLEAELEALRTDYQIRVQISNIASMFNQAQRMQAQQREAQQLLVNVEAARNDPNVRMYRNDAVLNADIAFEDALRSVYRATRVFEYYTSQSYPQRGDLYLVRMVTAGDHNLENYLNELENAFFDFEEQFGQPDSRVTVLSLRDDILKIPVLDDTGKAYSQGERINLMRKRLADPRMLDENGYLTIPFNTSVDSVSPLTRNHKIRYLETDIVGSDVGDTIGRVYVRQAGTGVIHNVADQTDYYVFPERTSVVNTFFNGNRVYDPDVYRNFRLRDRPYANTLWELVINQRDESVNRDIDLQSLSDIRVLVFYNDFTSF